MEDLAACRARARAQYPALESGVAFLENAGGSQMPRQVADRVYRYLLQTNVQLGATYPLSRRCTELVAAAHETAGVLLGAGQGGVVLGSSTSALLRMLGECYAETLRPGQEVIVAESNHEANIGPWKRLEQMGVRLRWWRLDRECCSCTLEGLADLLSERTALVALPHVSNLLGGIEDVRGAAELAHRRGARVVVDGVAFAPHRAMACAAWGVDWYVYSAYKVYGPHMAVLFGRRDAFADLEGPNHFFVPRGEVPYKFELGGVCHEGCAGLLGLPEYLEELAGRAQPGPFDRRLVEESFGLMERLEEPLTARLLEWLRSNPAVRIQGRPEPGPGRVGTISFTHERLSSREIVSALDESGVAIRHGHMYAWHLCEALGLDPADGVVRASLLHYNMPEEIERLIDALRRIPGFM